MMVGWENSMYKLAPRGPHANFSHTVLRSAAFLQELPEKVLPDFNARTSAEAPVVSVLGAGKVLGL